MMRNSELVTARQERIKIIVVLVVNHGFQSVGPLSESVGVEGFGTAYRLRDSSGQSAGANRLIDLAANAARLGATVIRAGSIDDLRGVLKVARTNLETTVIHIETDPMVAALDSASWWDVPAAEVATLDATGGAQTRYDAERTIQREYFRPTT